MLEGILQYTKVSAAKLVQKGIGLSGPYSVKVGQFLCAPFQVMGVFGIVFVVLK